MSFDFRLLRREDFPLLAEWLAEPLVARWWHEDPTTVEERYGPAVDGREPGEVCIALLDGTPFGLIQRYEIAAHPEYLEELRALWPVGPGTLSIDYLVGSSAQRGLGLGSRMIRAFVAESFQRHPAAPDVLVPVHAENRASWRALERAGFVRVATGPLEPDNPADSRDHVLYRLER